MQHKAALAVLGTAIGLALGSASWEARAIGGGDHVLEPVMEDESADTWTDGGYIIRFTEEGLYHYRGGIAGLARTAPAADEGARGIDLHTADAQAYLAYLEAQRAVHVTAIENRLGRELASGITHTCAITFNGVALTLTADEARSPGMVAGADFNPYQLGGKLLFY